MMRLLLVLLVLLFVGAGVVGCEEDQSSSDAAELGIQEGRRPVKAEKRPPPGPGTEGFQMGDNENLPEAPPTPPDD